MLRVSKDPDERRNEIIDVAEELFLTNGFEETTVSGIVRRIGVAQGLFYYYFKSKDEVLDAIAERYADLLLRNIEVLTQDSHMDTFEKIKLIFTTMFQLGEGKDTLVNQIHQKPHEEVHKRLSLKTLEKLIPNFATVIRDGTLKGFLKVKDSELTAEIFLIGLEHYLNRMIKDYWGTPEFNARVNLAMSLLEQALGAPEGSLELQIESMGPESNPS
jgi:AcrR family transcriptional regulator